MSSTTATLRCARVNGERYISLEDILDWHRECEDLCAQEQMPAESPSVVHQRVRDVLICAFMDISDPATPRRE